MCGVAGHGRFLFYIYSAKPKREKSTKSVIAIDTYCGVPSKFLRTLNGAHTYASKRNHHSRGQAKGLVNWGQVFESTSRQSSSTQAHAMTEGTICSLGCEGEPRDAGQYMQVTPERSRAARQIPNRKCQVGRRTSHFSGNTISRE